MHVIRGPKELPRRVLLARSERGEARRHRRASAQRLLGAPAPRNVSFVGSILVLADETVFCLFDGREEDVRAATVRAGVPFQRVLESLRIDGSQPEIKEER